VILKEMSKTTTKDLNKKPRMEAQGGINSIVNAKTDFSEPSISVLWIDSLSMQERKDSTTDFGS